MRKIAPVLLLLAALSFGFAVESWAIGFAGEFAPANWVAVSNTGQPAAADGSVDTSLAPSSILLIGGNVPNITVPGCTDIPCRLEFKHTAVAGGTIPFQFSYATTQPQGPAFDQFGIIVNDALAQRSQLSIDAGPANQLGSSSFVVSPGQVFGFYIDCNECILGGATATISAFDVDPDLAATPEPGTLLLVGTSAVGMVAAWRRRQRKQ